jgi:hypothetical protein
MVTWTFKKWRWKFENPQVLDFKQGHTKSTKVGRSSYASYSMEGWNGRLKWDDNNQWKWTLGA